MDSTGETFCNAVYSLSCLDLSFGSVALDVLIDGNRNLELMRIRIRVLGLSELLDVSSTKLEVLLAKGSNSLVECKRVAQDVLQIGVRY